ncbi:LysR family transcriptional regulator [Falsirhodobacter halotolerans]|uniref:LysR family transcriptional regulator n=1 Tax=Falsirhodobacter halotolerans TaxID=1146892 RepID=UPI001FD19D86|nr:LysR family transcriptional regulator [Falsirhodobacter halotolerans]MCJ8140367.1 LysR substrate-binding domain-containing protein [Falsirhodobacter halotolerans]
MHLELRHLRTIRAIHRAGGLARAAEMLNITQSALSHQVKGLEEQAGIDLFVRPARPLRLSAAGLRLLRLAERVLPEVEALDDEFRALRSGKTGRLHIAMECHACFEWLLPALEDFRHAWPDVDVDIRAGLAFDALPALLREEIDVVITSDPVPMEGVTFHPLFDYRPTFIASALNPLAAKDLIEAEDFRDQTLITYPVTREKLDIFTEMLTPARVEPRAVRPIELTAVILMLVAADRGVAVIPDWVLRQVWHHPDYALRPLAPGTITRTSYAALREADGDKPYLRAFRDLSVQHSIGLRDWPGALIGRNSSGLAETAAISPKG